MTVTSFTSSDGTATSSTAGGGSIYVYPTATATWIENAVSFFVSADASITGTIGYLYGSDFFPASYVEWLSSTASLYYKKANVTLSEFPISVNLAHHENYKTPCLLLDASGAGSVNISVKSG